jgi:chromosome segregation ATPase
MTLRKAAFEREGEAARWHERYLQAEAEVERLRVFVDLLVNNDADEREEILNNPKFWAEDYAHALDKLAEVMGIQEERDELRAEVERLTARVKQLEIGHDEWRTHARRALTEVERLREGKALWSKQAITLEAEVERLRVALDENWRKEQQGHADPCTYGSLCPWCEVERLKAALDSAIDHLGCFVGENDTEFYRRVLEEVGRE